ncbi:unnamed protein product [Aureobasidium uvarum]|uniref:MYND-type domain-containing protein n=1 Tax=Aureobasidium uvarum TaxID=2773716 RepID=A0A9N8PQM2_9PEZI|nr:unnamed protein product [Aureobasidium uvarum]
MAPHGRCASGPCRHVGTLKFRCNNCKSTYYCSKACADKHVDGRHKLTCGGSDAFVPLRPGVFNFMGLPREVRDKQAEYDRVAATISNGQPDLANRCRDYLDVFDRRCMASPEYTLSMVQNVPIYGFKPFTDARGLLFANKQISQELKEANYAKNTFLFTVRDDHVCDTSAQEFRDYVAHFLKAKKLYIDIATPKDHPGESGFQASVNTIKRQLLVLFVSLERSGASLDSLTVRYTSCFPNEIEDLRVDADGLATHKQARVIWVMDPRTDKMRSLNHTEMKQLYLHSTTIADVLCASKIPVSSFRVFGDFSGPDISRISRKFNIPVIPVDAKLDKYGQRVHKDGEMCRNMARDHPDRADIWLKQTKSMEQIFSTRAGAIRKVAMLGPPDGPEYDRLMAQARAI